MDNVPSSTGPKPFQLEPRQSVINDRLFRLVGPGASDFYKDACRHMFDMSNGQNPPISITHMVAHAIREVESSLRDVLHPFDDREIKKCGECDKTLDIPTVFCSSCGRVKHTGNSHKDQIKAILRGLGIKEDEDIAKAWLGIPGKYGLQKFAHRPGLKASRKPDQEFIDFWNKTEIVLYGVLDKFEAEYSKVFSTIDKIANNEEPQDSDVAYLSSNIPHNQITYERLFTKLDDPKWLSILNKGGFFKELPSPEYGNHEGSPTVRYPQWPAVVYLKKMATIDPNTVTQILLEIPDTDNATVKDSLLEVVVLLPSEKHVLLSEQISKWTYADRHHYLSDATAALLIKLINGGQIDLAFSIAKNLLEVLPDPRSLTSTEEQYAPHYEPITRLGDWQYKEFLENSFQELVKADPRRAFNLVCDLLKKFVDLKHPNKESSEEFEDYMYISRPSIEKDPQNHLYDRAENSLIDAVRDEAISLVKENPEVLNEIVNHLESYNWAIFKRIALYLIAENPEGNIALTFKYINNPIFFGKSNVKHEYIQLLDSGFGLLKPEEQELIFKKIEDKESIRDYINKPEAFSSEEVKKRYLENWEHEQLYFLKKHLKGKWKERYVELSKTYKDSDHLSYPSYITSANGPRSVVHATKLSEMDTDSIIELLRTWEPKKDDSLMGPSKEGLGRELIVAIKSKPELFVDFASRMKGLDPTYIRSYLQAFHELIQNDQDMVWEEAVSLCEWVLEQPVKIPGRTGHHFDQDPDWDWTRKAIASFVSRGINENKIPYSLRNRVWNIIEQLTHDPNPTPEEELDKSGKTIIDAYSLSINTTRGDAVGGVMEYALWVLREGAKNETGIVTNPEGFAKMPEVKEVLERHLDPKYDPSIAVRAVYGRFFPWLFLLDKEWTLKNKEKIFPKGEFKNPLYQAAWNTYISYVEAYNEPFKALREEHLLATKNFRTNPKDEYQRLDPEQRLAEHIVIHYGRGLLELDSELMVSFWTNAPDHIRAHALDFVGRGLIQTDIDLSEDHIRRLKILWETRRGVAESSTDKEKFKGEMSAFGWWFSSDIFEARWVTEEYLRALNIGSDIHSDYYVARRLVRIAESLPIEALKVLEKLIEVQPQGWLVFGNKEEIKKVLSIALHAPEAEAVAAAKAVIGRLLSRGYSDFGDLISEIE